MNSQSKSQVFDGVLAHIAGRLEQLAVGGRLVMPVGSGVEQMMLVRRTERWDQRRILTNVLFVPLTGEH